MDNKLMAIYKLDNRVSEWWSKVPVSLRILPSDIKTVPESVLPNILLIHIVHHQCLCALHSSIVPLFCCSAGDASWSTARQTSAQIAFENACAASVLIRRTLSDFPKLSAIPSFVGYAAYCGIAIQIPFLWCSEPMIREKAHTNVKANVKMINTLSKYWKFSAILV